jgi:hypothetical protein
MAAACPVAVGEKDLLARLACERPVQREAAGDRGTEAGEHRRHVER